MPPPEGVGRGLERTGGARYPGRKPPVILDLIPVSLSMSFRPLTSKPWTSLLPPPRPHPVQPSIAHLDLDLQPPLPWPPATRPRLEVCSPSAPRGCQ